MSNSQSITGKIVGIKPPEQKGQYTLRTFLLDISTTNQSTGEVYENMIPLQFFGDKCDLLNNFQAGQNVTVHYNIRGGKDKQTGKWKWVNLSPWKIELAQSQAQQPITQTVPAVPQAQPQNWNNQNTRTTTQVTAAPAIQEIEDDDLPF